MTQEFVPSVNMDNPLSLAGRSIIVTGSGQGIGLGIAKCAVRLGANVTLVDVNADTLAAAQAEIGEANCLVCVGSVADAAFVQSAVDQAVARFGKVDGLVNNAGNSRTAMCEKMSLADWQAVIDVHLTGTFLFTQAAGRHMLERARAGEANPGSIVSVSSDAGVMGTIGQINYSSAKAGVLGLSMSAAREWAKYGIRSNSVSFGLVETQMTETIRSEKFRDTYMARIPMARFSTPAEVAVPVCFLLSDAASYVTGQRLSVNGGYQMAA